MWASTPNLPGLLGFLANALGFVGYFYFGIEQRNAWNESKVEEPTAPVKKTYSKRKKMVKRSR